MILGLLGGHVLRSDRAPAARVRWLLIAGLTSLVSGGLLGALGICPVVKRIWTPSFALWSGGWCFLILAAAYFVIDAQGYRRWAFPLVVIGMNSIAAYCLYEVSARFAHGVALVLVLWLVLFWMYRRRLFLRI